MAPFPRPLFLVLALLAAGIISCTVPAPIGQWYRQSESPRRYLTIIDYYQAGGQLVNDYFNAHDSSNVTQVQAMIESAQRACVRITIRWDYKKENGSEYYTTGQGSGVLIEGGKYILSVGHNFSKVLDTKHRITAITLDGKSLDVELLRANYEKLQMAGEDWAILKNLDYEYGLPWVRFGEPKVGEEAVILGYPNNIGIDQQGRYVYRHELPQYLAPVRSVWEITSLEPYRLYPVAGSAILEGFSGGPILNFKGEVIGVLTGSVRFGGSTEIYVNARDVLDIINRYYDLEPGQ